MNNNDNGLENSILQEAQLMEEKAPILEDQIINPEQEADLEAEIGLETKYGDKGLRTFAESAASSATFGLSDQALVESGLVTQEELRERRQRNRAASIAGEVTGVVAPALLSGGSSVLAKGAATGVKTAAKIGGVVENLTGKAISQLIKETGKKSLAKEVLRKAITKGAGSAVEGSFYGAGKLISEDALGTAEFNAENLLASAGTAALLSGAMGSIFGTAEALVPVIKGDKIVQWKTRKFSGTVDPARNAQELAGSTPTQIHKMKTFNPAIYEHTPKMLKEVASKKGVSSFGTNKTLHRTMSEYIGEVGDAVSKSLDDVSEILATKGALPKRAGVAERIMKRLDDLTNEFKDGSGRVLAGAKPKVEKIQKVMKDFDEDLLSNEVMDVVNINSLKQKYQKMAKWDRKGQLPLDEKINREISRALREEVLDLSDKAGGDLGAKLRRNLLDYGSAVEFTAKLGEKIEKHSIGSFIHLKDVMLGSILGGPGAAIAAGIHFAKSDIKRKLIILSGVEKANTATSGKISSSVSRFFKGIKDYKTPIATKSIMESGMAYELSPDKSPKKPKTKKEAFNNIKTNLVNLLENPDKLEEVISFGDLSVAAPNTTMQAKATLYSALNLMMNKLPMQSNPQSSLFKREQTPSTIEMYKFEKYVEAIENPMSVLRDLENGQITREGVEVLQQVYPNLYSQVQNSIMESVSEDGSELNYQQRLNLGVLFDLPTDPSLNPTFIKDLQKYYSEAEVSQAGGVSPSRADTVDMAERAETTTQKIERRS